MSSPVFGRGNVVKRGREHMLTAQPGGIADRPTLTERHGACSAAELPTNVGGSCHAASRGAGERCRETSADVGRSPSPSGEPSESK